MDMDLTSFDIPSLGTPEHQPDEDLLLPQPLQQDLALGGSHHARDVGHISMEMDEGQSYVMTSFIGVLSCTTPHSLIQPEVPLDLSSGGTVFSQTPMSVNQPTSMGHFGGDTPSADTASSSSVMSPMTSTTGLMTGEPLSTDPEIVPQLQNIISTVSLGCKLDLKKIALQARNAEYDPRQFAAVIMRIREPRTTALIFGTGKMVCTGAKSEEDSRIAARKYARIVQKLGYPAKFLGFQIQNLVGSCDVKFPIRLEGLALTHSQFCSYEPELFPGLIYRLVRPRVVLLIFYSGKVVLTGAKFRKEIYDAFRRMYPILRTFKKK